MAMTYRVKRGDSIGTTLIPHLHKDGFYVASKTRFAKDYLRVRSLADLEALAAKGYKVRMSNRSHPTHKAPSLVIPVIE